MQLLETVEEMRRDCENLYGPRGWQRALRFAVKAVEEYDGQPMSFGLIIPGDNAEQMDRRYRMMREEAAAGDAYVLIDVMVAYGWAYTDKDGNEWTGKPQKVQVLTDDDEEM